ncbi:MAG: sulfite exporter TauE/SafE family protein [Agathobacter sp.]|nr:sulfite exporter TauE/SafE family protein [Agathobacter sp.]
MEYVITFIEGIISFISPCMLPMLPLYISYFAGNTDIKNESKIQKVTTFTRSLAFVLGFTLVFTALGVFAGSIGTFFMKNQTIVNIICGFIIIYFGLSYLNIVQIPFLKGMSHRFEVNGLLSAFLFGMIYSISLTPCVGAFLGSALMLASSTGGAVKGAFLLLSYSLGLGIPFLLSALLIEQLQNTFTFIKKHYKIINTICGIFLIIIGILMVFGMMNYVLAFFS